MRKNLEIEYTFLIPRSSLAIKPPKKIVGYELDNSTTFLIDDILYGRTPNPLTDEKIGVRFRKQNSDFEFTYKKFLGRDKEVVRYDEYSLEIDEKDFFKSRRIEYDSSKIKILDEISKKGKLYLMLEIVNKRVVYSYLKDNDKIDVMVEDVQYLNEQTSIQDASMEIEINVKSSDEVNIKKFVEKIKLIYSCKKMSEGKNVRGLKLLG